tara:strand:+ start:9166 stop:10344 length:1179 start_codon:yes stop_codon:yes gene_type:complete
MGQDTSNIPKFTSGQLGRMSFADMNAIIDKLNELQSQMDTLTTVGKLDSISNQMGGDKTGQIMPITAYLTWGPRVISPPTAPRKVYGCNWAEVSYWRDKGIFSGFSFDDLGRRRTSNNPAVGGFGPYEDPDSGDPSRGESHNYAINLANPYDPTVGGLFGDQIPEESGPELSNQPVQLFPLSVRNEDTSNIAPNYYGYYHTATTATYVGRILEWTGADQTGEVAPYLVEVYDYATDIDTSSEVKMSLGTQSGQPIRAFAYNMPEFGHGLNNKTHGDRIENAECGVTWVYEPIKRGTTVMMNVLGYNNTSTETGSDQSGVPFFGFNLKNPSLVVCACKEEDKDDKGDPGDPGDPEPLMDPLTGQSIGKVQKRSAFRRKFDPGVINTMMNGGSG